MSVMDWDRAPPGGFYPLLCAQRLHNHYQICSGKKHEYRTARPFLKLPLVHLLLWLSVPEGLAAPQAWDHSLFPCHPSPGSANAFCRGPDSK